MSILKRRVVSIATVTCGALLATMAFAAPLLAQCIPPPANLSDWWRGDGTSVDPTGGHDATLQNGATYGAGEVGQAFQLDGTDDYVNVPADPSLDVGTGDFTVDFWVKFNSTGGEQVMVEKWVQGASVSGWTFTKQGGDAILLATQGQGGGENDTRASGLSIPSGTWIHLAARRQSGALAIFMNGSQIASGSDSTNLTNTSSLKFGHRGSPSDTPGSNDNGGYFLNGEIDEVQLFVGHALSDADIQAIYAAGTAGQCGYVCGNNVLESGEGCDDGNLVDGDGCDSNCTPTACGNGIVTAGEMCDDGNANNNDSCKNDCTANTCGDGVVYTGVEACDDANANDNDACKNDCTLNACGDGVLNTGVETCDDGNTVDGDGCDSNCTPTACGNGVVTAGEACDDGNANNNDGCKNDCTANTCGDGVLNVGVETCDDGNTVDDDGCDSNCRPTGCGNGVVTAGETCDDGNANNNDGCKNDCTPNICGDAVVNIGVEQCDDGNNNDNDACKSDCTLNVCGDGVLRTGIEQCDDHNTVDGDGCDSNCTPTGCGNGVVSAGELCDDGNLVSGDGCDNDCQGRVLTPAPNLTGWWPANGTGKDIIGGRDASLQGGATFAAGEVGQAFDLSAGGTVSVPSSSALNVGTGDFAVDFWAKFTSAPNLIAIIEKGTLGGPGWILGINSTLGLQTTDQQNHSTAIGSGVTIPVGTWHHYAFRRESGSIALFFDGAQVASGNDASNLDSSSPLYFGFDPAAGAMHGLIDEVQLFVGHSLADAEIQAIYAAGPAGQRVPVCGNNVLEPGETCDDGNTTDGDGCDSNCTPTGCGNHVTTAGEQCDDGNLTDGDGCDSTCQIIQVSGCIAAPANLTAWWTGNDTAGDVVGGYNATLHGGATYGAGEVGDAFQLNGTDAFVDVAPDSALDFGSGDFTVDFWVNFNATAGEQVMVEKWIQKDNGDGIGWTLTKRSGNSILLATSGQGNGESDASSANLAIPTGTWTHFAARKKSGTATVFMNGTQIASSSSPYNLNSSASLKFGHRGNPTDTPGSTDTRNFFLNGQIDEVQLFVGRALPDAEIQGIFAAGHSGQCVALPVCGNGLLESGEACDDANTTNGDGCESDCTMSCGNHVVDPIEGCDDGNLIDGDGCDSNCTPTACGNGIVTAPETCDDGNLINGDGCDSNCTPTACGNGIATPPEMCDDGNAIDGDGCESDCTITPIVQQPVSAGGTVSTDPTNQGATPSFPVQTSITTPNQGTVSITVPTNPTTATGYTVVGTQLQIDAPPASAASPLMITLTVDASAIPADVDPNQLGVTRNGVVIADCTGPAGTASPDPCIASRMQISGGDLQLTVYTSHASLWSVVVRGLFPKERTCVKGAYAKGVHILNVQAAANNACLAAAKKGTESHPQGCLIADTKGALSKAEAQTTTFTAAHCVPSPPFGFTADTTINTAAQQAELGLVADVFGNTLDGILVTDKHDAACQAAVLKSTASLFKKKTALFAACLKSGLVSKTALIVSAPTLAGCYNTLTADSARKIAKAVTALRSTISTKCTAGTVPTLLPGPCGGAVNVARCLDIHVECRLCRMLNSMDGLNEDCDLFDDGVINQSCP